MMDEKNKIRVVDGSYAAMRGDDVIGVVGRVNESQWAFWPLVDGDCAEPRKFILLNCALECAISFQPR